MPRVPPPIFRCVLIGHAPPGSSPYFKNPFPRSHDGVVIEHFCRRLGTVIQASHDLDCACDWTVDPDRIFQIDLDKNDKSLERFGTDDGVPLASTRVTGAYPMALVHDMNPNYVQFAAARKQVLKRKSADEDGSATPKRVRADPGDGQQKIDFAHGISGPLTPDGKLDHADACRPVYLAGTLKMPREPPSDFIQAISSNSALFDDLTWSIRDCFELTSELTWGFFAPYVSRRDSTRLVKAIGALLDKHYRTIFELTFGRLAIGPWARDHPHTSDFIVGFDFGVSSLGVSSVALTLTQLRRAIVGEIATALARFFSRYKAQFPANLLNSGSDEDRLSRLMIHCQRNQETFLRSKLVVQVFGYDELARLAHIHSLTGSPSTARFPTVTEMQDVFTSTFYTLIYKAQEDGIVSLVLLQGQGSAFVECLPMVPAWADMNNKPQVVGGVGFTHAQIKGLAVALHGKTLKPKILGLLREFEHCLPYYYPSSSPFAISQVPRSLVYPLLPALKSGDDDQLATCLRDIASKLIDAHTNQFLTTLVARGVSQWQPHANELFETGSAPMSRSRLRYSYADVAPDVHYNDGIKHVKKPNFQTFMAACFDEGMVTLSKERRETYTFPSETPRLMLIKDIFEAVDNKDAKIPPPFDGSPKWVNDVLSPYLRKSRTMYSVLHFSESEAQSILHQKIDTSITVGAGITNHVVLEFETIGRRRIDLLAVSLSMLCIIELKNIKLADLYEATMGVTLERAANGNLTGDSLNRVNTFFDHMRSLPLSLWTDSSFNSNYTKLKAPKTPRTSFPKTLDEFFYHGWCGKKKGTFTIYALWASADIQAEGYADELNQPSAPFDDTRFRRHSIAFEDENGEKSLGEFHVLTVIVIAGICVLARRSKRYSTPKKTQNVLFPVGKPDH